jgi:hypothetical protein
MSSEYKSDLEDYLKSKKMCKDDFFKNSYVDTDSRTKKKYLIHETMFNDKKLAEREADLKRKRKALKDEYFINLADYSYVVKKNLCSTNYLVTSYFDFPQKSLKREIFERKKNSKVAKFSNEEMTHLFYNIVLAGEKLQQNGKSHGNISPYCIYHTNEGKFKLAPHPIEHLSSLKIQQEKSVKSEPLYVSPQMLFAVKKRKPKADFDPYKADVFAFGLVLLEAGLLKSIGNIYSGSTINETALNQHIKEFETIYCENPLLFSSIQRMLELGEDDRANFTGLTTVIPPYKEICDYFYNVQHGLIDPDNEDDEEDFDDQYDQFDPNDPNNYQQHHQNAQYQGYDDHYGYDQGYNQQFDEFGNPINDQGFNPNYDQYNNPPQNQQDPYMNNEMEQYNQMLEGNHQNEQMVNAQNTYNPNPYPNGNQYMQNNEMNYKQAPQANQNNYEYAQPEQENEDEDPYGKTNEEYEYQYNQQQQQQQQQSIQQPPSNNSYSYGQSTTTGGGGSYYGNQDSYNQNKPSYNYNSPPPENNYVQPAVFNKKQNTQYSNPPSYNPPTTNYQQPQTTPSYQQQPQTTTSYQQQPTSYVQSTPTYTQPSTTYSQPTSTSYTQPTSTYTQPTSTYTQPSTTYNQPTSNYTYGGQTTTPTTTNYAPPSNGDIVERNGVKYRQHTETVEEMLNGQLVKKTIIKLTPV